MITVYSAQDSSRLQYILSHLLTEIVQNEFEVTNDIERFKNTTNPKISYGEKFNIGEFNIPKESNILFENNISENSFKDFISLGSKDLLTLSFLLMTRYQEYLGFRRDRHGRFPFSEDKLFKKWNVEKAWVDELALSIKEFCSFPKSHEEGHSNDLKMLSTIDIDRTWQYKSSPKWLLLLKKMKYHLKNDQLQLQSLDHYLKTGEDPYDTFNYIDHTCELKNTENQYFSLMANHKTRFDFNINPNNLSQSVFLKKLNKKRSLGIHPSYESNKKPSLLNNEIQNLSQIIGEKISKSRQHYIKLAFPQTYQNLIKNGIEEDYSMGFPGQIGFRAGTSFPFYWFDLTKNERSTLKIFPFPAMDVTLKNYLHLKPEDAIEKIQKLKNQIKKYGGYFIPIFHNQNLTDKGEWKGWRKVFEQAINN